MNDVPTNGASAGDVCLVQAHERPPPLESENPTELTSLPLIHAHEAAMRTEIEKLTRELAFEREKNARTAHKHSVASKVHQFVDADPEVDSVNEFDGCELIVEFIKKTTSLLHLDTGPSERAGLPMTGALLLDRWMRRAAVRRGLALPDGFYREASEPAELKVHARFNLAWHWLARGVNAFIWREAVRVHGLEGARAMKSQLPLLSVRGFQHLVDEAHGALNDIGNEEQGE